MNAINPTIDEVSERTQEYADAWFSNEEPISSTPNQSPGKQDPELEKIILQFSRWYGNEPWTKAIMRHDDILRVTYVEAPILTEHSIEYLTCGHKFSIIPASNNHVELAIHWDMWR